MMRKKRGKIISLLVTFVVIFILSLTAVPALANGVYYTDWEYSTWHQYATYDDFISCDSQVTGYKFWQAGVDYHGHPRPPIEDRGWEVTLDSDLDLTWNSMSQHIEIPDFEWSDGTYEWTFEQVDPIIFVHPVDPIPVDFTPKFDASRTVDRTTFLQSEGLQNQTLTVSITPDVSYKWTLVFVAVEENDEFPIVPAENIDESDLVDAKVISGPSGAGIVADGSLMFQQFENEGWPSEVGEELTFDVEIEVTPNVAEVEFMPEVWIVALTGNIDAVVYEAATSHSHSVDSLGTWTWNSEVPYEGTWVDYFSESVAFLGYANILVGIDIKPGSNPNSINPNSKGVIPVAVLTTPGFDAAAVDPDTVVFGPDQAEPVRHTMEDVDHDGDFDLVLHFNTQDTGIEEGATEAILKAETWGGTGIVGTDSVRVISK